MRLIALLIASVAIIEVPVTAQQCQLTWVSHPLNGANSNNISEINDISDDGRFVCFQSYAENLIPGSTSPGSDIFLFDRLTGVVSLVSVGNSGLPAQQPCYHPSISGDGTAVAFWSTDPTLDPGNSGNFRDVFVRDLVAGTTRRVSVSSSGAAGDGDSMSPDLSSDGRFVAFISTANNLVPGDDAQGGDAFVHDRLTGETRCETLDVLGKPTSAIGGRARISPDGSKLLYISLDAPYLPGDSNGFRDAYLKDRNTGIVQLVSCGPGGVPGNGICYSAALSGDGRTVVFDSSADNLVPGDLNGRADVFARDVASGTITRLSVGPQGQETSYHSSLPEISRDGRFVAFASQATGWFPGTSVGTSQICLRDRLLGTIQLVSVTPAGQPSNASCLWANISGNGNFISFIGYSGNLLPPTAGQFLSQVLLRECTFPVVPLTYCTAKINSLGCRPQVSSQGASSSSQASGFLIRCDSARNQKVGLLMFGWSGRAAIPFQNGTLCVNPPLRRGPPQSSGGSALPTSNCSGTYSIDMNSYAAGLPVSSPARVLAWPGTQVQTQWWGRDPGFVAPNNTMLSDALEYFVGL